MRARSKTRLRAWLRQPAAVLAALQIAAIVVTGAVTVLRFDIFAAVDERANVAYVQEVAEHGRLPWLGRDYISWQVEAVEDDVYPRHSSRDPRRIGLAGLSYEAFEPPLYYALAAPAFRVTGNYRDKVIAVRAFDLLLFLAAVGIVALLARAVCAKQWLIPYCLALAVLMWPGVIVRAVTVSNAALEFPIVLLYLLALWHATARRAPRLLVAAAALFGLCVLTKLTWICLAPLLLMPLVALLRERRDRRTLVAVAVAIALPLLVVAPWLASNESRYGAVTSSRLATQLQAPFVDPTGQQYGVGDVTSRLWRLSRAALPQEWWQEYGKSGLGVILRLLPALLLVGAVLPIVVRPSLLRSSAAALLATPLPLGLATLVGIVLLADWPAFLPRYVYPTLAPFALFAAWAWNAPARARSALLGLAAGSSVVVAVIWVYLAGAYYFTNVGGALGIHAARL